MVGQNENNTKLNSFKVEVEVRVELGNINCFINYRIEYKSFDSFVWDV